MFADLRDLVDNTSVHMTEDNVIQAVLVAIALTAIVLTINAGHFAVKGLWRGAGLLASVLSRPTPMESLQGEEPAEKPVSERCRRLLRCLADHRRWAADSTISRGQTGIYVYETADSQDAPGFRLMAGPGRGEADNRGGGSPWLASVPKGGVSPTIDLLDGLEAGEDSSVLDAIERMIEVVDENTRRVSIGLPAIFPDEPQAEWHTLSGDPIDLDEFCRGLTGAVAPGWYHTKKTTIKIDGKPVEGDAARRAAELVATAGKLSKDVLSVIRGDIEQIHKDVQRVIRECRS